MALPIYSATGSETDVKEEVNFFVVAIDQKCSRNERILLALRSFCILLNQKIHLQKKVRKSGREKSKLPKNPDLTASESSVKLMGILFVWELQTSADSRRRACLEFLDRKTFCKFLSSKCSNFF